MKKTPSHSKPRTASIRTVTLTDLRLSTGGKPLTTRPDGRIEIRPFETDAP